MLRRNQDPVIHLDPAFEELGLVTDRTLGRQAIYYAGFEDREIRALHLADNPDAYEAEASDLLSRRRAKHAIIGIGDEVTRGQQGLTEEEAMARSINEAIYRQLATLANITPRQRSAGSYLLSNIGNGYLSCVATGMTAGMLCGAGLRPGPANFTISASIGIYTAIKLSDEPDAFDRHAHSVRRSRQGESFDVPAVVSFA